jgi:hypothetical protein
MTLLFPSFLNFSRKKNKVFSSLLNFETYLFAFFLLVPREWCCAIKVAHFNRRETPKI